MMPLKWKQREKYIIAQRLKVMPKNLPTALRRVIGIDPGELFTGIAICDLERKEKQTMTLNASSIGEMIEKVAEFISANADKERDIVVVEVTYLSHPSVAFIWQIVGVLRFLFPRVATTTPNEAAAKGLGYGKLKLKEKKERLAKLGWGKIKNDHEVAAATAVEWAINILLNRLPFLQ